MDELKRDLRRIEAKINNSFKIINDKLDMLLDDDYLHPKVRELVEQLQSEDEIVDEEKK